MKNCLLFLLLVLFGLHFNFCISQNEMVLRNHRDSLSYAMGAANAQSFTNDENGQTAKLDLELVASGLESNLNGNNDDACRETLKKYFGEDFESFDSTYRKEASECLGMLTASELYRQMKYADQLSKFDMKKVAAGFRHGLTRSDTLLNKEEKDKLLQDFVAEVTESIQEKMSNIDAPFLTKAKALPNTKEIDGGIIMETIKSGTGASPTMYDDVEVHYILTNAIGDTLESSIDRGQPLEISLLSVVPGWTMSFPQLKKGGKYRLYIPSELAYKQGALCFYIELISFGKMGTIVPMEPY